jgi:16S rRNA (cytidine1402-2'-O)-methyltransferase
VTLRALRVLRDAVLVLAEDTRTARRLLDHHGIRARLLSYTEHNHAARVATVLAAMQQGDVALVSEAGMPGINDPGQALVQSVLAHGGLVTAVPGPSAVPLAVALAGFLVRSFTFLGFLPHRRAERRRMIAANAGSGHALVAFETPHRIRATLADLAELLGERRMAVCRELTKLHEEVVRGSAAELRDRFPEPRGEFTLVVEAGLKAEDSVGADELGMFLAELNRDGAGARAAVAAAVARFGVPRRQAYTAWRQLIER